ncbi:hypothetical protein ACI2LD_17700 [Enterococcus casseliflavus]|uniref:hypothetical protein n=1 Tax=Enterococcus casseliflavus TaxID=37734 RepID=UPI0037B3FCC6
MKNIWKVILIIFVFLVVATFSFTIKNQQNKISELEAELQLLETKYMIIINDPLTRDAMEAGG